MQLRGGTFAPTLCGSACAMQSLHQQNKQGTGRQLALSVLN